LLDKGKFDVKLSKLHRPLDNAVINVAVADDFS
jgi:hypothetical protein